MHLILTGATGLVGSSVLEAMIKAKDVTKISILSRRPIPLADDAKSPKVNVIIHRDFAHYDADLLRQLRGAQGCVWALGISQTKVDKDAYVTITQDYALAAATSFASLGQGEGSSSSSSSSPPQPFRFVYVSGEGATQTPGRFSAIFARVKGATEQRLADLADASSSSSSSSSHGVGALRVDSVRPGFVDASQHEAIRPYVPDPGLLTRAATTVLGPVVRAAMPGSHAPTPMLGSFLTQMALGAKDDAGLQASGAFRLGRSSWIVPNAAIRKSMGLDA